MSVLRVSGSPKFSAPPSGETMHRTPKVFEVQERVRGALSLCQAWWARISPAVGAVQNVEFYSFVCLCVTLLNVRVYAPYFAMKALEYRNGVDALG